MLIPHTPMQQDIDAGAAGDQPTKMNMSNSVTLQVIEHAIIREFNQIVCRAHNLVEFTYDGMVNHL
jgi:hypothetical protein